MTINTLLIQGTSYRESRGKLYEIHNTILVLIRELDVATEYALTKGYPLSGRLFR